MKSFETLYICVKFIKLQNTTSYYKETVTAHAVNFVLCDEHPIILKVILFTKDVITAFGKHASNKDFYVQ